MAKGMALLLHIHINCMTHSHLARQVKSAMAPLKCSVSVAVCISSSLIQAQFGCVIKRFARSFHGITSFECSRITSAAADWFAVGGRQLP